ncbi:serine carboxypeptidase-like 46 [Actinidia rufa]|uniref:Serine carboxypeptidase-like 46 n=1 Tax=Actinidia rufa TaxID=165716 RepID=A0A7J0GF31_9ERIC|nr:serine carboxypeptidase-like 46 [Actinidia rufa]
MLTQAWLAMAAIIYYVNFQQFAGYIRVDEKQDRSLFYYFVEAETNPSSKPLVLWLNGGPGCSSIGAGAFCEHGPFKPSGQILVKNDFSWNKGTGLCLLLFCVNLKVSMDFKFNARQSCFPRALVQQIPRIQEQRFVHYGESYGGHYVPQLAQLMVQSKMKFNLKGIAIGNPLLEFNTDFNARGEYFWSHGLVSDATYELFNHVCNYSQIRRQAQTDSLTPVCHGVLTQASREISKFINSYDVTLDICLPTVGSQAEVLNHLQNTEMIDVCVEDETLNYLNREDVHKAFHARLVGVTEWSICSDVIRYDMQNLEIPTIGVLGSLVKSGIRVMVYSGDQDSVIPLTGTRTLVNDLAKELGLSTTVPYRVWFEGRQVGGWTQVYGDILSFATIRGASHEAPFSQPERSLVLFNAFLGGKTLPEGAL